MPRQFPAVQALIRQAVVAAAEHDDPLATLAIVLRLVAQSEADPYMLLGLLTAAMVGTIVEKIPQERQQDAAAVVQQMLADRLKDTLRG